MTTTPQQPVHRAAYYNTTTHEASAFCCPHTFSAHSWTMHDREVTCPECQVGFADFCQQDLSRFAFTGDLKSLVNRKEAAA